MSNKVKLLTASNLLQFVKENNIGENRATLTRYQASGILTLPCIFSPFTLYSNDIPDTRVKYYHPVSVIEFIVNTLLFKGCWLRLNECFHIARSTQTDVFTGRISFFADPNFLKKYEGRFIDCGIGSFKTFSFSLESNPYFQDSMIRNSLQVFVVDREIKAKKSSNSRYSNNMNYEDDQLFEIMKKGLLDNMENGDIPTYTKVSIDNCQGLLLEQLRNSLSYSVFHSLRDTRSYMEYQKMLYARTFEQVVEDYLPAILEEIDMKEFNVDFYTGIKE